MAIKMKKKAVSIYTVLCFLIFCFGIIWNADYFYRITYDNIIIYQWKQALSLLFLYGIGFFFLKAFQKGFQNHWIHLLAFPCGLSLWVFAGQALLLCNKAYFFYRVCIIIGVMICSAWILKGYKQGVRNVKIFQSSYVAITVIATAFLLAAGFYYVIVNYDSYIYFVDYGKAITAIQDYRDIRTDNSFVLTNIGQYLPMVNSYVAFWGIDYAVAIQSGLIFNFIAIFVYAVYENIRKRVCMKKAVAYTLISGLCLVSCTCFLVYSSWMLSNAYLMIYLSIMGILGSKLQDDMAQDQWLVITGCALSITLLRKDGIIIVCIMLVCYSCYKIKNRLLLLSILLPSAFIECYYIYYVRKILYAETTLARGNSILSNRQVIAIGLAILVVVGFIVIGNRILDKIFKHKKGSAILFLLLMGCIIMIVRNPFYSYLHLDAIFHVLLGSSYGVTIVLWGILLSGIILRYRTLNYEGFLVMAYCLLTFIIYSFKGNVETGIDNSGMRAFVQIVPMFFFWASKELSWLVESKEEAI